MKQVCFAFHGMAEKQEKICLNILIWFILWDFLEEMAGADSKGTLRKESSFFYVEKETMYSSIDTLQVMYSNYDVARKSIPKTVLSEGHFKKMYSKNNVGTKIRKACIWEEKRQFWMIAYYFFYYIPSIVTMLEIFPLCQADPRILYKLPRRSVEKYYST